MKHFLPVLSLFLLLNCTRVQRIETADTRNAPLEMRVMSYNIRFNNPADGNNAWPLRKSRVAELIAYHSPDVIGMQEVLRDQLTEIADALPAYSHVGVGRDDGVEGGEYAPVFYRTDLFTAESWGTRWLSETPDMVGSRGWDAALPRIVTWVRLRAKSTGRVFFFLNTHFDHAGRTAQLESARLLRSWAAGYIDQKLLVILAGDFNLS